MIRSIVVVLLATLALIAFRRLMLQAEKMRQRAEVRPQRTAPRQLGTLRRDPETGIYEVSRYRD